MTRTRPGDYRFEVYNPPTGMGTGTYTPWLLRGADVEIDRSLLEGDLMTIRSSRNNQDPQIDRIRPVRFYWKDPHNNPAVYMKMFDGCIRAPRYDNKSNKFRDLGVTAYGWEKELQAIQLDLVSQDGIAYTDKSIDFIFTDLARIANDFGIMKKAMYVYDTGRLPYYDPGVFGTVISRIYGESIWAAMQDLTKELDIAETSHLGEWVIKVDALQSNDCIYIIPILTDLDVPQVKTYREAILTTPKRLVRNYTRLNNFALVRGQGTLINKRFSDTLILPETGITADPQSFLAASQPSTLSYLKFTIKNSTAAQKGGWVQVWGNNGAAPMYTEQFYIFLPKNTAQIRFSDRQYFHLYMGAGEGSSFSSFETTTLDGCTIKVEEILYGVAGRSLNKYGMRGKPIRNINIDTQLKVDRYAAKQVRMYHAPLHDVSAVIKPQYVDSKDVLGRVVSLYDNFISGYSKFICMKQYYYFGGAEVNGSIDATKYNYDWDYLE